VFFHLFYSRQSLKYACATPILRGGSPRAKHDFQWKMVDPGAIAVN
jgi:hypothetical protein